MKIQLLLISILFVLFGLTAKGQTTINDAYDLAKSGKLQEAIKLANVIIEKDISIKDSLTLVNDLCITSFIHGDAGNYIKANDYLQKGLNIWEKLNLKKDNTYLTLKNNVVLNYKKLRKYEEAINLQNKILSSRIILNGINSKEVANAYDDLAVLYEANYDAKNAIMYYNKELSIEEKIYGTHSDQYLNTLNFLGIQYLNSSQYDKSIDIFQRIANIAKESTEGKKSKYWDALNNIAQAYRLSGQYNKALNLGVEIVKSLELTVGKHDKEYIQALENLATYNLQCDNIQQALKISEDVKLIIADTFGKDNVTYITAMNNLANTYFNAGKYEKAIEIEEENINISKDIIGENNPLYATYLNNLSTFYARLGNYQKAIDIEKMALKIQGETVGKQHEDYASSLNNLGQYLSNSYRWGEALSYETDACNIIGNTLGRKHPRYAAALRNLANCYRQNKNLEKSTELYKKSLEITKDVEGSNCLDYAFGLQGIAGNFKKMKNFTKAIEAELEASEIFKKIIGTKNFVYLSSISNLGLIYEDAKDYKNAEKYLIPFTKEIVQVIKNDLKSMTSIERRNLWEDYSYVFDGIVELSANSNKPNVNSEAYNAIMLNKGFLLDTEKSARKVILNNSKVHTILEQLNQNIITVNQLYTEASKDKEIDSLQNTINLLRKQLINNTPDYAKYLDIINCSWQDVQKKLNDNEAAVEFFSYFPISLEPLQKRTYIAMIIRKGYDCPKIIELCKDSLLRESGNEIVYKLIWKPIEHLLDGVSKIYFSPCDTLNNFPLENLSQNSSINSDNYTMIRLTSTRQLLKEYVRNSFYRPVLFGGLKYTAVKTASVEGKRKNRSTLDDISEETKLEIDSITSIFKSKGISCTTYEGTDGTEDMFKSLSETDIDLLHISTHGYYYSLQQYYNGNIPVKGTAESGLDLFLNKWEEHALSRTGLILAGAKELEINNNDTVISNDGYLSGLEIENMNFPKLDMVVLSACETGLGDTFDRDGVLGLQRAFKKAGAQTILMSLWKVDSEATRLLMTEFYRHYLNGESKHASLKAAQQYLRNYEENGEKIYDSPKYWAAFVLLDALD